MILAAKVNKVPYVEMLLKKGANINYRNYNGRTALMYAASTLTAIDSLNYLLSQSQYLIDYFLADINGKTALDWARLSKNLTATLKIEKKMQDYLLNQQISKNLIYQEKKKKEKYLLHEKYKQHRGQKLQPNLAQDSLSI